MKENVKNDTIIMIGNGFDLSLGLPTSYKDFVESSYFQDTLNRNNYLAQHIYEEFKKRDCNWVDIEMELGNYSKVIYPLIFSEHYKHKAIAFQNDFLEISRKLKNYLINIPVSIEANTAMGQLISDWNAYNNISNVISFNYTRSAYEMFFEEFNIPISYIHGRLSGSLVPVLGIDESLKVPIEHSFLYKSFNPATEVKDILEILDKANKFIIYGCSLGETDEFYFKHVFENVKSKSFEIYYYGEKDKFDIMNRIHLLSGGMHKFRCYNEISFTNCTKYSVPSE